MLYWICCCRNILSYDDLMYKYYDWPTFIIIFILWLGICEPPILRNIIKFIRRIITDWIYISYCLLCNYEWAKRTKNLLKVIYTSPWRHSNSSKIFTNFRKKIEVETILVELLKTMNRMDLTRPRLAVTLFDDLFLGVK